MFLGYKRPDGKTGIRNYVLVLPVQRMVNSVAMQVSSMVRGAKTIVSTGEIGRSSKDRRTIARTLTGLALNGNVGGVLIIGDDHYSSKELKHEEMAEIVRSTGKPVEVLDITESGGYYNAIGIGAKMAQRLALQISEFRREQCDLKDLTLGVKCGTSDPTSGVAGNPVVGKAFDVLVNAGGTAFFSETTEVIGAEDKLAKRCINEQVKEKLLNAVSEIEEKARATGEDIRNINPIPENVKAGISTLEEKSLGAITKSGSMPILDVLTYGERPPGNGLYFIDGWMSSLSLPLGMAAAGANLFMYQLGGQGMPDTLPPMPAYSAGIVTPMMYLTGNPRTCQKAEDFVDFCSGKIMEGKSSIEEMADKLLECVLDLASGTMTKTETVNIQDPVEFYLEDPCF